MKWCFDMSAAPRHDEVHISIAIAGCTHTVRNGCVWSTRLKKWLGLLPGDVPVAWVCLKHPHAPDVTLPKGMIE